ncbi:MAG: YicC family protein, partial [Spirochaetaceae bacterium]|nr:YicC family protein [Spirochaetaceae bacterium]
MKSMTGYAYREISGAAAVSATEAAARILSIEIKSYNSRFLDLSVYMPGFLGRIESRVRDAAKNHIQRGKVDVNIRIRETSGSFAVTADIDAAKSYHEAIQKIARSLGQGDAVPLSLIVAQEGVLRSERESDPEEY